MAHWTNTLNFYGWLEKNNNKKKYNNKAFWFTVVVTFFVNILGDQSFFFHKMNDREQKRYNLTFYLFYPVSAFFTFLGIFEAERHCVIFELG